MCGIAGFSGHGDRGDLLAMMRAIRHRGPDGEGMHQEEAFGLFLGTCSTIRRGFRWWPSTHVERKRLHWCQF